MFYKKRSLVVKKLFETRSFLTNYTDRIVPRHLVVHFINHFWNALSDLVLSSSAVFILYLQHPQGCHPFIGVPRREESSYLTNIGGCCMLITVFKRKFLEEVMKYVHKYIFVVFIVLRKSACILRIISRKMRILNVVLKVH